MTSLRPVVGAAILSMAAVACCTRKSPDRNAVPAMPGDPSAAASSSPVDSNEREVIPGKARWVLSTNKPKLFLGENILIHVCLENIDQAPIQISMGGDYRGASRALRYKLTASDSSGTNMPDPDPSGTNFGGMGWTPTLKPGESNCESLQLMRYVRIDAGGVYKIKITHDLGWKEGEWPAPGELTIDVAMPNAAQAAQVAEEMALLPADPNRSAGKKSIQFADWTALRYPIYLPMLSSRASSGQLPAVTSIGQIPNPEATRTLIGLLSDGNDAISLAAAQALTLRLPDPELSGKLPSRNPFFDPRREQRTHLTNAGWRPEFAVNTRSAALRFLSSGKEDRVKLGAFMLQCVGIPQDGSAVITSLTLAIENTAHQAPESNVYPRPRGACQELLRAAQMLVARGFREPAAPSTSGELALYLVRLSSPSAAPPKGWEGLWTQAAKHPVAYIRELAFKSLPKDAIAKQIPAIRTGLQDTDTDVKIAACDLAEQSADSTLLPELINLVASAKEVWLFRGANDAAAALGSSTQRLETLAKRLHDQDLINETLGMLIDSTIENQSGRSSSGAPTEAEAQEIESRWLKFLANHRGLFEAKQKIPLGDPRIDRAMFPKGYTISRRDGSQWP